MIIFNFSGIINKKLVHKTDTIVVKSKNEYDAEMEKNKQLLFTFSSQLEEIKTLSGEHKFVYFLLYSRYSTQLL